MTLVCLLHTKPVLSSHQILTPPLKWGRSHTCRGACCWEREQRGCGRPASATSHKWFRFYQGCQSSSNFNIITNLKNCLCQVVKNNSRHNLLCILIDTQERKEAILAPFCRLENRRAACITLPKWFSAGRHTVWRRAKGRHTVGGVQGRGQGRDLSKREELLLPKQDPHQDNPRSTLDGVKFQSLLK